MRARRQARAACRAGSWGRPPPTGRRAPPTRAFRQDAALGSSIPQHGSFPTIACSSHDREEALSYLQAIVIALVQGTTELFPVSSLGHSVLVPAWLGGSWQTLVTQSSQGSSGSSFYLAYIVALHCATALALLIFFRVDWLRIVKGFLRSARRCLAERRFSAIDSDERLAWLIVLATIPVGITGLALEHVFRTVFAKPVAASTFLVVNGLILLAGERTRRRTGPEVHSSVPPVAGPVPASPAASGRGRSGDEVAAAYASDLRISRISYREGLFVGALQTLALFAGISRSGVTMVGGLWRGLSHEDAARFAFLLATPVILAAGVLKLPSLAGHAGDHIHGQVLVGSVITGVTAYLSVRYLVRYFETPRSRRSRSTRSWSAGSACCTSDWSSELSLRRRPGGGWRASRRDARPAGRRASRRAPRPPRRPDRRNARPSRAGPGLPPRRSRAGRSARALAASQSPARRSRSSRDPPAAARCRRRSRAAVWRLRRT